MKYSFFKICIIFDQYFSVFHYLVYNKKRLHSDSLITLAKNCEKVLIVLSKIDENRCKQTVASLP